MALVYCVKCETIIDDRSLLPNLKRTCPECSEKLFYFGRERVVLSPKEIILNYDKSHKYNPVKDYSGKFETVYEKQSLDLDIIECEDTIKYEPDNIEARYYLATRYYSLFSFEKASEYFHEILALNAVEVRALKGLADIYICKKAYKTALNYLKKAEQIDANALVLENLGIVYVHLDNVKKAINYFLKAYKTTDSDRKRKDLKVLVRQLMNSNLKKV